MELTVNGQSLGTKDMPRNGHVEWSVPYAPGTVRATGYDAAGKAVGTDTVMTTGAPAALKLTTDRTALTADGEDVTMVTVSVVDAQGRVVPTADNRVTFHVTGAGHVAGVGNGDPSDHDPDKAPFRRAFGGLCLVVVGAGEQGGPIHLTADLPRPVARRPEPDRPVGQRRGGPPGAPPSLCALSTVPTVLAYKPTATSPQLAPSKKRVSIGNGLGNMARNKDRNGNHTNFSRSRLARTVSNTLAAASAPPSAKQAPVAWDAFLNPVVAALATALLLGLCTHLLLYLRVITNDQRPYTILYLIPVAVCAAFLGVRGGVLAALAALVLARVYLFNDQRHGEDLLRTLPRMAEDIEFVALAAGTLTIAAVTGRLRQTLGLLRTSNENLTTTNGRLENANAQLVESEAQRRVFNRDVLLAVTGGKLRLVEPDEVQSEEATEGEPVLSLPLSSAPGRQRAPARPAKDRLRTRHGAGAASPTSAPASPRRRPTPSSTATAARRASGSTATDIAVEIQDRGTGIAPAQLARATLEAGFSTRVSLGMGFHMMLQTVDTLALCTSDRGTTVLLQVSNRPRATDQESLLARYASL